MPSQIADHGQIRTLELPPGWVEGKPVTFAGGPGAKSWREIHPEETPDAALCFYYRGLPVDEAAGQSFRKVLSVPLHDLDRIELDALEEILRGKSDPEAFDIAAARTDELNGKRILSIIGRVKQSGEDVYALLIDADGTGRVIQEIYFQAPTERYEKYLGDVVNILLSIRWK